jgi:GNAT superfamily N-acetyltransferase
MTEGPHVRSARPDEAETLFELQRSSALAGFAHIFDPIDHPFPDEAERSRWASYVTTSTATVLVAEYEADPVGVAVVEGDELVRLFVAPQRWGMGIGSRLHEAVIE